MPAEAPGLESVPFEEFLRICTESGLLQADLARTLHGFARALGGVGSVPRVTGSDADRLQSFESILSFDYPENMTFESYVTTEENYYTCEILRTISFIPRIWKAITPVFIHAPTGQGKTHLLAATRNATTRKALLINTLDLETEYQHARSGGQDRDLRDWLTSHDLLLIDDIQFAFSDGGFQKFIISVMNRMPRNNHGIVVSSDVEPAHLGGMVSSLLSRLMSGITIKLEIVDLKGRREILEQFFKFTGLQPPAEVVDHLAMTFTTNVRQLKAAARMVLARMLGTGRPMTVDSARALLGFMTPSASPSAIDGEEDERSPYIVVEVEEEEHAARPSPPTPPAEPASSPADSGGTDEEESADKARTIVVPVSGGPPPTASARDAALEQAGVEVPAAPKPGRGSARKFKQMLESADTVEKQTEALRLAVSERIRQLSESGGDRAEVGRLQVALRFLEKGDLEAAMLSLKS